MDVKIREAKQIEGKPKLQELYDFGIAEHYKLQECDDFPEVDPAVILGDDRLIHCDIGFVAELDGEIVGAVSVSTTGAIYKNNRPTIDGLYVSLQNNGIGNRLLIRAIESLIERNFTEINVHAVSDEMILLLGKLKKEKPEYHKLLTVYDETHDTIPPEKMEQIKASKNIDE